MLTFKVEDMTCNHCAGAITRALKEADAAAAVEIDVAAKRVSVNSQVAAAVLSDAIRDAGYTPVTA